MISLQLKWSYLGSSFVVSKSHQSPPQGRPIFLCNLYKTPNQLFWHTRPDVLSDRMHNHLEKFIRNQPSTPRLAKTTISTSIIGNHIGRFDECESHVILAETRGSKELYKLSLNYLRNRSLLLICEGLAVPGRALIDSKTQCLPALLGALLSYILIDS